ncbi:MAG TPA: response regulator [Blastocatellia bacterium]|nr:response regulator [Blastocatellia bacterium]
MAERKPQILIIEDDEYSREALEYVLKAEGYETLSATEGRAGYRTACQVQPDVVVIDLRLPDVDGRRLIRLFRRSRKLREVPILVVTGFSQEDIPTARELGADLCLTKPVALEDYTRAVRDLITGHAKVHEPSVR